MSWKEYRPLRILLPAWFRIGLDVLAVDDEASGWKQLYSITRLQSKKKCIVAAERRAIFGKRDSWSW